MRGLLELSRRVAKDPLSQEREERAASPEPDPEKLFTVLVSTRSFLKFLNSHVVSTTTIACVYPPFLFPVF
jgi:HUS1 checkpoint protein